MNTQELVTILTKQFVGWNRDGDRGVLPYLNQAQRILCTIPSDQLMIINEATGELPSFDTVKGTSSYNLPSTVNFIDAVLVKNNVETLLINNQYFYDYGGVVQSSHPRELESVRISGIEYSKIIYIRSFPWTEQSVAKITFTIDPGNSTGQYQYRGYKLPTKLVSETIPLTIHPPYETTILLPATAKLIEGVQSGNYLEAYETIQKLYIPQMKEAFNIGAFGVNYNARDRGF